LAPPCYRYSPPTITLDCAASPRCLERPRVRLWVLNHAEMRENARVRALSRHLALELPATLALLQAAGRPGDSPPSGGDGHGIRKVHRELVFNGCRLTSRQRQRRNSTTL